MAYIEVEVDVDIESYLEEVRDQALIRELESRGYSLANMYSETPHSILHALNQPDPGTALREAILDQLDNSINPNQDQTLRRLLGDA